MRAVQAPWGTAGGVLRSLAPESRVLVCIGAVAVCLVSDPVSRTGLALMLASLAAMQLGAFTPSRVLAKPLALAILMIGPVFVLSPFTEATLPADPIRALVPVAAPFRVFMRGIAVVIVGTQTIALLTRTDLGHALARLPIPAFVAAIVQQVIRQLEVQATEIHRIGLAMRARGAARGNRIRTAFGLPQAWMGRLLFRAQRSTLAMEARGYAGEPVAFRRHPWTVKDLLSVSATLGWVLVASWLRWRGGS